MSPRLAAASLTALLLAAGLACGGDSAEESTGPSEEANAKVRAVDYARAVNLRASDVPYFEPAPPEEEEDPDAERRREAELRRCLGVEDFEDPLAEVPSPTYGTETSGAFLQVESSVQVSTDATEVAREAEMVRSPRAERCLRDLFLKLLEEEETQTAEARRSSLRRIPFPAAEIEDGFGYRFRTSVTVHGDTAAPVAYRPTAGPPSSVTVDVYIDLLGFISGRAAVSLNAMGAPAPVNKNLERNLLRLLHDRATERSP